MGYLAAVLAVSLAVLARAVLDQLLHDKAPLLVFVLAVLGAALYGGLSAGLAATGLSIVAIDFFFLAPRFDIIRHDTSDFASLALFAVVGAATSALVQGLHRANRAALERQQQIDVATAAGGVGIFELPILSGQAVSAEQVERMFATPNGTFETSCLATGERMRSGERERVAASVNACIQERQAGCEFEFRTELAAGRTRSLAARARLFPNASGSPARLLGAIVDVTAIRESAELRTASLYARSLLEASLDPLVTISPQGQVTDVNQATEVVTGVPRERLIGSSFSDYFTEPAKADAGYRKVLSEGLVQDYPLTIRHLSGRTTDVLYNAVVYRNEAGEVQGVFAAARDVTERKRAEVELARYRDRLEELVRLRTAELEDANAHLQSTGAELARSNQELEQFAYVASHDLQEPLRAVTGYLGLLEGQLAAKLDDNGRHRIAGAVQGAQRMHTLITDLLALSRVGTRGQAFEATDLNTALDLALDGLRAGVAETGASITRDPLPTLPADAVQMVQLFQNLIGNALKFRGDRAPEIHVGAERQPDRWVLAVRDNGIGIEPQYYDRIFLVFQRLHTRRLYPGTGIGLAICKKIVERHGGSIRVESQPGQGSTFYVTIPSGDIS